MKKKCSSKKPYLTEALFKNALRKSIPNPKYQVKNTIFIKENECTRSKEPKIFACGALHKGKCLQIY